MKKLIVASNNEHKILEIKQMLKQFAIEIMSLREANIDIDVEETGTTFEENAYIKANTIHKLVKDCMVLSDDSGLMVDSLGGAPGVYSARYAGEHGNSEKNNQKLLEELEGKKFEDRKARFVCSLVLITEAGKIISVKGEVEGYITDKESGQNGFGYDPLFYIPEYNMTFSEMSDEMKNSMSHRGRALEKLKGELSKLY